MHLQFSLYNPLTHCQCCFLILSFFFFYPPLQVGITHTISSHLCFSHSHSDLIRFSSVQNYLVMRVENETGTEKGSRIEGDSHSQESKGKEIGASRKESEKAAGLRCSEAADVQKEAGKDNVLCVLSVHIFKFH